MATKGDVSGLDVLMFGGEPLIPMLSGLRTSRRSGVVQSESSGGMVRQRKNIMAIAMLLKLRSCSKPLWFRIT